MHEQNESQPKAFIKILFALFTALLVVVLGYLCIQIYTIFHRTYKTETAIAYTMSDNITLKGVAVFRQWMCLAAATWDMWCRMGSASAQAPFWRNSIRMIPRSNAGTAGPVGSCDFAADKVGKFFRQRSFGSDHPDAHGAV